MNLFFSPSRLPLWNPHDLPSLSSLLDWCSTTKNLLPLVQLHCQAIKLGFSYNDFVRAKLISSYSSCAKMADAHLIFSFTNRKSTFLYNTLIRGYANTKDFHLSLSTFHQLLLSCKTVTVDRNTLPAVLKSVSALSLLRLGQQLHGFACVRGFSSDLAHTNALITMYGKCGDLLCARKLFDEMPARNLITWCSLMSGYGLHGEFDEVFGLFDRMLVLGYSPDGATFTSILTACRHVGKVEEGKDYFDMLVHRFQLSPSLQHYTCLVDMLGRAGRLDEAQGVLERMEMEPDEALWRAFLGSCRIHGKYEMVVRGKWFKLTE